MDAMHSAKEEVKRAADIVEVVGRYVQLRKAGQNYVGLCPFHSEKAPSFTVSPSKQMFHCFGCKKGGDVFAFWMEYHNASFPEALRELAQKFGVNIPEKPLSPAQRHRAEEREEIFRVNERAMSYFARLLNEDRRGLAALRYVEERGISREIIEEFRLGFAPDRWDGLVEFLKREGLSLDTAAKAGLVAPRKSGGYYDRFRGRLIFPIFDLGGRVLGFGGRVLDDGMPKYLNTPETPVFQKGRCLYGLHAAYRAIRGEGSAVVVEGYMDFLALRNHGLAHVVATLGTALTADHIRKLRGYAPIVVLVFDADEAGDAAVLKSLPLFLNEGVSAKAVQLPKGEDPDSFVNQWGLERFRELVEGALPLFDFYLERACSEKEMDLDAKARVLKQVAPILSEFHDAPQRALYAGHLAEKLGIRENLVWEELRAGRRGPAPTGGKFQDAVGTPLRGQRAGLDGIHLLNLLIHYPDAAGPLMESDWKVLVSEDWIVRVVEIFFERYARDGAFAPESLLEQLEEEDCRKRLREALLLPPFYSVELAQEAAADFQKKIRKTKLARAYREARARGDMEGMNQLLKQMSHGPQGPFGEP
ncbi:MAG: DNA primase [Deltaproteobacteria bacterium]|nr:DNA primase [Deltaproteobacteria bacterium]MBW2101496.1 DNA primase [Deltaproteobacteria bacterium]MBW2347229.1 DNA primase [Deltaproteobacteria bacterium]